VNFRITDSDPGLPEEFLDKWNQEGLLRSTKGAAGERGSALGLSLSREFVKANQGSVFSLSSESGTQVIVELPASLQH
jgi:signal transduction histidine kinase